MKYAIFLLVSFLFSCNNDGNLHCKVFNQTGAPIDSLRIEPSDCAQSEVIKMAVDESKWYTVDMSNAKFDGVYIITYWQGINTSRRFFGYYTNGHPYDDLWSINIHKDTILVDKMIDLPTY